LLDLAIHQIHTPVCSPCKGRCVLGRRRLSYPHIQLFAERLLSNKYRYPHTGRCTCLARLAPLRPSLCHYGSSEFTASARCRGASDFPRPTSVSSQYAPFEAYAILPSLWPQYPSHGRRALPPTLPSHLSLIPNPITEEAARLRWRVHFSHLAQNSLPRAAKRDTITA